MATQTAEKTATTQEVAQELAALCREGNFKEAVARYYADDIVTVEAMPTNPETRGLEAVQAGQQEFVQLHEIHNTTVDGPYLNGDGFAVRFKMDFTVRDTGQRMDLEEIGVYTVTGGKVSHVRFYFPSCHNAGQ